MSGLTRKRWYFFVWDEDNENHLSRHFINTWEAEELFFNKYIIVPNKKKHGLNRFLIYGKTNAGRNLRLVFEDLGNQIARIITGWDI